MGKAGSKTISILGSIRFAVLILILIVLASIIGTIIPQNWIYEQYSAKYGDFFAKVILNLQISDVYHSYWYAILLGLFCINLCFCSIQSFGPLVKSLKNSLLNAHKANISELQNHDKFPIKKEVEEPHIKVMELLARSLYRFKFSDEESKTYYFERGKTGRLGPFITHASIIVILIGGIIVGLFGFKQHVRIPVGETIDAPHSDFQVRADDFKAEFYEDSTIPKEYTSVLSIIEDGQVKLTKSIEVNHPMSYKGVRFYQSAYGLADMAEVELYRGIEDEDRQFLGKFRIDVGEEMEIPNSESRLKLLALIPDFVMDESGRVGSRSRTPRNPAILAEIHEGDKLKQRIWSFKNFPNFHATENSEYRLNFLSVGYYTELQVSKDRGLFIVWIGCILMVVGMFLSFYVPYKRLWIKFSKENGDIFLEVGGRSYKNRSDFGNEFQKLRDFFGNNKQQ
ncbi:hypothetical protein GF312_13040 [Candidatus Poribacteria bacterium]|nr:hypothetical protein [Candidatus Poribacteria bacterium]